MRPGATCLSVAVNHLQTSSTTARQSTTEDWGKLLVGSYQVWKKAHPSLLTVWLQSRFWNIYTFIIQLSRDREQHQTRNRTQEWWKDQRHGNALLQSLWGMEVLFIVNTENRLVNRKTDPWIAQDMSNTHTHIKITMDIAKKGSGRLLLDLLIRICEWVNPLISPTRDDLKSSVWNQNLDVLLHSSFTSSLSSVLSHLISLISFYFIYFSLCSSPVDHPTL